MSPSAFFDEPTTDIDCGNADQNQHDDTTHAHAARRFAAQDANFVTEKGLVGPSVVVILPGEAEDTSLTSMATSSNAPRGQLIGHKDTVQWNNLSQRVSHE